MRHINKLLLKCADLVPVASFILLPFVYNVSGNTSLITTYPAKNGMTCYECREGMFWVKDCEKNLTTAACSVCPQGTFNNKPGIPHYCQKCSTFCPVYNAIKTQNCTSVADIKCECRPGYFKNHKSKDDWFCKPHSDCHAAFGVEENGTTHSDTKCKKCKDGTYSNSTSKTEKCALCSTCTPPLFEVIKCNAVNDTVCSHERPARHREPSDLNEKHVIVVSTVTVLLIIAVSFVIGCILLYCVKKRILCFKHRENTQKQEFISTVLSVPYSPMLFNGSTIQYAQELNEKHYSSYSNPASDVSLQQTDSELEIDGEASSDNSRKEQDIRNGENSDRSRPETPKVHSAATLDTAKWNEFFSYLSQEIIPCWEFIIRDLLGERANSTIIEAMHDCTGVRNQIYFCLDKWRQKDNPSSIEPVITALRRQPEVYVTTMKEIQKKFA